MKADGRLFPSVHDEPPLLLIRPFGAFSQKVIRGLRDLIALVAAGIPRKF
jgi:hypothetical protein